MRILGIYKQKKCHCCNHKNKDNHCECSASINFRNEFEDELAIINAEICPQCTVNGSRVFASFRDEEINFTIASSTVFPPSCFSNESGKGLTVTGHGTILFNDTLVPTSSFSLSVFDSEEGFDQVVLVGSGLDEDGDVGFIFIGPFDEVSAGSITVRSCSTNTSLNSTASDMVNIPKTNRNGTIILNKSGKIYLKEFKS